MANNQPDRLQTQHDEVTGFIGANTVRTINRHTRLLANIDGHNGIQVNAYGDRLTISGRRWRGVVESFGWKISGQTFTVHTGTVFRGRSYKTIAETAVTISGGTAVAPHYVYIRFEMDDLSTAEIPTTPLASMPTPNDTYWQVPLYAVFWNGTLITIVRKHHFGDFYVPGQFDQS